MSSKDKETSEPARPARADKSEAPAAPPVQEYPKMLYHADGSTKTVATKDEEAAATKAGFADKPVSPEEPTRGPRAS